MNRRFWNNWLESLLPLGAVFIITAISMPVIADSVGPAVVAKADNKLWQPAINTTDGFNLASRASLLVYTVALHNIQKLTDAEMLTAFKIKSINRASVEKWVGKESSLTLQNYQRSSINCLVSDWTCVGVVSTFDDLLKKATESALTTPSQYLAWRDNLKAFTHAYVSEQIRLAALFPKVSSEIDLFNDNEWNGDHMADRQFSLSFDDGPTPMQGATDETLDMLSVKNKTATFFVLGDHFQSRLNKSAASSVITLYKNQCVASHGWEHQSHAKWEQWQDSIKRTQSLLNTTLPVVSVLPLFRPPYGQRKNDSGEFFKSQALRVALWNLDSQDWNSNVDVNDITNRMITLMLIKRHGVLLFHDVHPKAKVALPIIFEKFDNVVEWQDCHQLSVL